MTGSEAESPRVPCVACREPILLGARTCPHCQTSQRPERLRIFGSILTWIGGITAVISLVIGAASVNELYTGWRDRAHAVQELLTAARLQLEAQDYEGGWTLLDEALKLDPASQAVRDFQVPFAMAWLRNIRIPADQKFSSVVDRLLPILYRGAANPEKIRAADVYAHIGWANYLKYRDGNRLVDIELPYRRSLELDRGNPFANAHMGHWLLNRRGSSDTASKIMAATRQHFSTALQSGRERGYVSDIAIIALLQSPYEEGAGEALRVANEIRKSRQGLSTDRRSQIRAIFRPVADSSEKTAAARLAYLTLHLPARELVSLYAWINENGPDRPEVDLLQQRYIAARLNEEAGATADALQAYRSIASTPGASKTFQDTVVLPAIRRLTR